MINFNRDSILRVVSIRMISNLTALSLSGMILQS
jgi:hypothetical protein